jgi:hypothetical protein
VEGSGRINRCPRAYRGYAAGWWRGRMGRNSVGGRVCWQNAQNAKKRSLDMQQRKAVSKQTRIIKTAINYNHMQLHVLIKWKIGSRIGTELGRWYLRGKVFAGALTIAAKVVPFQSVWVSTCVTRSRTCRIGFQIQI